MITAAANVREHLLILQGSLDRVLEADTSAKALLNRLRNGELQDASFAIDIAALEPPLERMRTACSALGAIRQTIDRSLKDLAPSDDDVLRDVAALLENNRAQGPLSARAIRVLLPGHGYSTTEVEAVCKRLIKSGHAIPVAGGYHWKNTGL